MKLSPQEIKTLLEDLYKTDPSLRERENDLIKIVQAIASAKPDVKMDKTFFSSLRSELLNKAKTLSKSMKLNDTLKPLPKSKVSFSKFWPAIGFTFSGVAVGVMAMLFVMQDSILLPKKASVSSTSDQQQVAFNAMSIDRVASFAFGSLTENESSTGGARGMGGGGGNAISARSFSAESAPVAPSVAMADGAVSQSATTIAELVPAPDSKMRIMPPYEQTITEYVYKGDAIELKDASMDVYKRINSSFSAGNLASVIQGLNLGIANISSFRNANVSDISIYQDEAFGYQIYLSPRSGTMSIDQNWEKWQSAYPNCQDDACWRNSQLKESDIPPDEELIRIADTFLAEHGIDRTAYGAGEVDQSWKQNFVAPGESRYVPDVMGVTYPLLVENRMTYVNGGMKMGINVSVNLRVKKVSSVYNIQSLKFEASAYDAESDTSAILESAKKGGLSSPIRYMDAQSIESAKKLTAELGTPVVGLVQIYQYKDNQSLELYVPALIFPVTKKSEGLEWSQNSVIVPLVKGFEDELNRPLPYMLKGAEGSAASGGTAVQVVPPTAVIEPAPALIDPAVKR